MPRLVTHEGTEPYKSKIGGQKPIWTSCGRLTGGPGGRVIGLEADPPMASIAQGFILGVPAAAQ
ncbi:MAG: hypothetical protein V3W05_00590 [candidate division NC10 bacterium]